MTDAREHAAVAGKQIIVAPQPSTVARAEMTIACVKISVALIQDPLWHGH
jgi:hypothetical protein